MSFFSGSASFLLVVWFCIYTHAQLKSRSLRILCNHYQNFLKLITHLSCSTAFSTRHPRSKYLFHSSSVLTGSDSIKESYNETCVSRSRCRPKVIIDEWWCYYKFLKRFDSFTIGEIVNLFLRMLMKVRFLCQNQLFLKIVAYADMICIFLIRYFCHSFTLHRRSQWSSFNKQLL